MRLYLLVFCLIFTGCEEILDSSELPYEEKLVINGVIYADSSDHRIQISRTLPLNIPFDTNAAFLTDAEGEVTSGGSVYPLEYIGHSGIYAIRGLKPIQGSEYLLTVRWRELEAEARALVPISSKIDTAWIGDAATIESETYFDMNMRAAITPGSSVRAGFRVHTRLPQDSLSRFTKGTFFRLVRGDRLSVHIQTEVPEFYFEPPIDSMEAVVYTFGPGYYDYFISRTTDAEDPLSGGEAPIYWNVTGDGIGGFFGVSVSTHTFSQ